MFLGWKAGLGVNSTKKLSSLSTRQLGLTDWLANSLVRLAETKASKGAILEDKAPTVA